MTYLPTQEDLALLTSHSKSLFTRIELLNKDSQIIDSIEGLTLDGSGSIDADSDTRRTYSLSIFPKKGFSISQFEVEDWIEKMVRIYVGMKSPTDKGNNGAFFNYDWLTAKVLEVLIQSNERYIDANIALQTYIAKIKNKGLSIYGNINNLERPRIIWTEENLKEYADFSKDIGPFEPGDYSTICGCDDVWTADNEAVGITVTRRIAYTLFIESKDALIPISRNDVMDYISDLYRNTYDTLYNSSDSEVSAENISTQSEARAVWSADDLKFNSKLMELDALGLSRTIGNKTLILKNMIAAVEGNTIAGVTLSSADVAAIAGWSADELEKEFKTSSQFVGYSMHDIQGELWELRDGIEQVRNYLISQYATNQNARAGANFVDENGVHWFSAGVYIIQSNGITYDATTNKLDLSCVDLVALLDGTLGGTLTGYATRIPMYKQTKTKNELGETIYEEDKTKPYYVRNVIKDTFELSGMKKSVIDYWKRRIPHDMEYSTGTTVWTILTELRDLYYPFEMYFDDDTFVCKEIPNGYDDPVVLDPDLFKSLVISEDASVDYTQVHNCVEAWGTTITSDYFCKDKLEDTDPTGTGVVEYDYKTKDEGQENFIERVNSIIKEAIESAWKFTFAGTNTDFTDEGYGHGYLLLKLKNAKISDGTRVSFICPSDIKEDCRIYIQNDIVQTVADKSGAQSKQTIRQVYGPMMLYKASPDQDGADVPEDTTLLKKGRYYVIQYGEKYIDQAEEGAYKYVFNSLTGKYDKTEVNPKIQYIAKEEWNEKNKAYETVYYKITNTEEGQQIEKIGDPALIKESRVYFLGQSQSHAMAKFVDKMPSDTEIEADKKAESCDNLEYVVVTDPKDLTNLYNSRFTIDRIGRRNLVCTGGEFDGYTNDEDTMTATKYQLWKNCRLTDTITLKMHLIPWLDVNQKVKYAAKYLKSDVPVEWITKKIDTTLGDGTMSVTLSRYYPYYPYITYKNVAARKYTDTTI